MSRNRFARGLGLLLLVVVAATGAVSAASTSPRCDGNNACVSDSKYSMSQLHYEITCGSGNSTCWTLGPRQFGGSIGQHPTVPVDPRDKWRVEYEASWKFDGIAWQWVWIESGGPGDWVANGYPWGGNGAGFYWGSPFSVNPARGIAWQMNISHYFCSSSCFYDDDFSEHVVFN